MHKRGQYLTTRMLLAFAAAGIFIQGCGSGVESDDSGGGSSTASATSFPADLALASPTAARSATSARLTNSSMNYAVATGTVPAEADYSTKKTAVEKVLKAAAAADCKFVPVFETDIKNADCYGPEITIPGTNHPDGNTPNLPGGDVGLWAENDTSNGTQACAAAQLNKIVSGVASQVDSSLFAMASMVCVAKVNSIALPEPGDTLDITEKLSENMKTNGVSMTLTLALMSQLPDKMDGNPVYLSLLVGDVKDSTNITRTVTVRLKHIPLDENNATYRGKLSYTVSSPSGTKPGNCTSGSLTGFTDAVSIAYEKASATSLRYKLQSGQFCGTDANPFKSVTEFTVDPDKTYDSSTRPQGWGNNFNFANVDMNPVDMTGNFQFAWQAGALDTSTRVMNVGVTSPSGTPTGCAYFGFGPAATADTGVGTISKFYCNWLNAGGGGGPGGGTAQTKAQRQCFNLDTTTKKFVSDSSRLNILYAPRHSCDKTAGWDYSHTIGGTTTTVADATTFTNNLVNVSSIDVTAPTAPTDVDL